MTVVMTWLVLCRADKGNPPFFVGKVCRVFLFHDPLLNELGWQMLRYVDVSNSTQRDGCSYS